MSKKINTAVYALIIFAISVCWPICSFASGEEFNPNKIPADLKKDADAVVRSRITKLEIKSGKKAVLNVTSAVTVFNNDGRGHGVVHLWYDSHSKVTGLEAVIYDARGEEVKELDGDDIKDFKGTNAASLCDDYRVKTAELYYNQYPYTVEIKYEITFYSIEQLPPWYSRHTIDPVELGRFELSVYDTAQVKTWCNRDSVKAVFNPDGSGGQWIWEERNLPLLPKDIFEDDPEDLATVVRVVPISFKVDDFEGKTSTWKDIGLWNNLLWENRAELPPAAIADIHALTDSISDKRSKVEKVYRYMQDRTRYISIQLGIGGYQPMKASFVHEKGYGDCKALSNYTIALLKAAGITSYPMLINAGDSRYPFVNEFPSLRFNHVMAFVPLENDTILLECTSQILPMGAVSSSVENRCALLLLPNGGQVFKMPVSTPDQNQQARTASVVISGRGNIDAAVKVKWSGNFSVSINSLLEEATPDDKAKLVENSLHLPGINLKKFEFSDFKKREPVSWLRMDFFSGNYAGTTGGRMFLNPNIAERQTYIPADMEQRSSPYRFRHPELLTDSISFQIPTGCSIESMPPPTDIKYDFAEFHSKIVRITPDRLLYIRTFRINVYQVAAEKYRDLRKFYSDVVKADRGQVVLIESK